MNPENTFDSSPQNPPGTDPESVHNASYDTSSVDGFFGGVIFAYTRREALADGVLVDVSPTAYEAGFRLPVALSASVWADIQDIAPESGQDAQGRLWDVLTLARVSIAQAVAQGGGDGPELLYNLLLPRPCYSSWYTVKSVIGPGDDGKPVLTLMRPEES